MRHKNRGRKLGRNSSHRKALGRNLLISLFQHGQIITTLVKAKEYSSLADRMISLAKRTSGKVAKMQAKLSNGKEMTSELQQEITRQAEAIKIADFRRALAKIPDNATIQKLFYEIAPLFAKRQGGYTSVLRLNNSRIGDNAPQAVLRLTETLPDETQKQKTREEKKRDKEKLQKAKEEMNRKQKEKKEKAKEKAKLAKERAREKAQKEKERKQAKKDERK
ncbi:MAG: 50S ribosomal protein L17 [Candidatus Brocadiae bacterium]|nr:50S ribosomal protein L17 [Candidatus Brocadiia bacterium]